MVQYLSAYTSTIATTTSCSKWSTRTASTERSHNQTHREVFSRTDVDRAEMASPKRSPNARAVMGESASYIEVVTDKMDLPPVLAMAHEHLDAMYANG